MSILVFLIVLSILIVVHEWGHFITAKKCGVNVEQFAVGFGPKLFSRVHDGTEFKVCAIPLGGYVKMAGDEREHQKGEPDEFLSKTVGQRAAIVFNGPLVNFVLAYICFVAVFFMGYPGGSLEIKGLERGGPAQVAGVQVGDQIKAIDGKAVYGTMHLDRLLAAELKTPFTLTVQRGEELVDVDVGATVGPQLDFFGRSRQSRDMGIDLYSNRIGSLAEDAPAFMAGLKPGDEILQIDMKPTTSWRDIEQYISKSTNEKVVVKFRRGDVELVEVIEPTTATVKNDEGEKIEKRVIGIGPEQEIVIYHSTIPEAFAVAYSELHVITVMTVKAIGLMVTGAISAKESVGGPVLIFSAVKAAAEMGFSHLMYIVGVVSASLAIFNLLPIIPLDGGHLFLLLIEKIRGKVLPVKVEEWVMKTGYTVILAFALFVFYIDFERIGLFKAIAGLWEKLSS